MQSRLTFKYDGLRTLRIWVMDADNAYLLHIHGTEQLFNAIFAAHSARANSLSALKAFNTERRH